MAKITQFKDVILLWPTAADFGRDVGVNPISARAMKQRNRIPSKYWAKTIEKARERGFRGLTYETLVELGANHA